MRSARSITVSRLEFKDPRTPVSPLFGDVYFSPASGIAESRYVYLEGSGFLDALDEGQPLLTVGEIGFGVGLNFLLTLQAFREKSRPDQHLRYFSFEQNPVHREDLIRLYSAYPELKPESEALLCQYPLLTPGIHLIPLLQGRVLLYLCLGDANHLLPEMDFRADHWFWDGFAPRTNPEAFSEALLSQTAHHSSDSARGSSFTSAGWVRRALEGAGFTVLKQKGFGTKRECIRAQRTGHTHFQSETRPSWFSSDALSLLTVQSGPIAVVGAGLGGTAIARSLAELGFQVEVFDPNGVATRASGNPIGLFNAQLSKIPNPISRFAQGSLASLLRELERLSIPVQRGILRTHLSDPAIALQCGYPEDFQEVRDDGLYFKLCGMLDPVDLCKRRLDHPNIRLRVEPWAQTCRVSYDHVVYSVGADLHLPVPYPMPEGPLRRLPTRPIRGQIILVTPDETSSQLKDTLVEEGYATPIPEALSDLKAHLIGATYQAKTILPDQEARDTEKLLTEASRWREFSTLNPSRVLDSRVSFRLSTPDKLPLIGPLCDPSELEHLYGRALRGLKGPPPPPLPALRGEWVFTGFGSRGITNSAYGAEILSCLMTGAPLPVEADLWEHLHSARFFLRQIKRGGVQ